MSGFPAGTAARLPVSPLAASPATSRRVGALRAVPGGASHSETPRKAEERSRRAERKRRARQQAASARKIADAAVLRSLASVFELTPEASAAYDDLKHALLLARERGQGVPCTGPDSGLWLSDDADEQELAADRCWDCPAVLLCKQYADATKVDAGTWGGETRDPTRRESQTADALYWRARKRPAGGRECGCGCDGWTKGGRYLPGHDARHLARLLRYVRAGAMRRDRALALLAESPHLRAKLAARFT